MEKYTSPGRVFRVLKDRPDCPESRLVYCTDACNEIKCTSSAHGQNEMLPNLGLQLAFLLELSMAQIVVLGLAPLLSFTRNTIQLFI